LLYSLTHVIAVYVLQFALVSEAIPSSVYSLIGVAILYDSGVHWVYYIEQTALLVLFITVTALVHCDARLMELRSNAELQGLFSSGGHRPRTDFKFSQRLKSSLVVQRMYLVSCLFACLS